MTFKNDYWEAMKNLVKQVFAWKKFKAMPKVVAVFCGILVIPFAFSMFMGIGVYALLVALYKIATAPVQFVHRLVHKEGQEVKHATQAVIYLISWPIILFAYIFIALISVFFSVIFFLTNCNAYVCTFGGVQFLPFVLEQENRDVSEEWMNEQLEPVKSPIWIVFIVIGYTLLFFIFIFMLVNLMDETATLIDGTPFYSYLIFVKMLFEVIYIILAFRNKKHIEEAKK